MIRKPGLRWTTYGRAGLVLLMTAVTVANGSTVNDGRYLTPVTGVALLCGAALLLHGRLPWQTAPLLIGAATVYWGWLMLAILVIALFDLAVQCRGRAAAVCAALALSGNLLSPPQYGLWTVERFGSSLFMLLLAVAAGLWLGNRRRLLEALAAQVDHLRIESELREEAARSAERSHIAAEMHDVLAHRLSLIALHTGVLTTRSDTLPAPVAERLVLLRTTSTEALADLRDVLGALRDPQATDAGAALVPAIRDVGELVEEARAAGQNAGIAVEGHPEQAPTTHRLAVYRIVQEALTNARKHAAGSMVSVRVDYRPPATLVEVTNTSGTPDAAAPVDSGYGLIGLRERVTALGGHLNTGPAGGGTWRLAARSPHPTGLDQNGTHP